MRKLFVLPFVVLALLALAIPAFAQNQSTPGSPVMQVGQRGDAAQFCSSSAAATLTLPNPGAGMSNYVDVLGLFAMASGIPTAATPTGLTATGIAGTTPAFLTVPSVFPAAGAQGSVHIAYVPLSTPIKGLTATSVALVIPTAITNFPITVVACWHNAP